MHSYIYVKKSQTVSPCWTLHSTPTQGCIRLNHNFILFIYFCCREWNILSTLLWPVLFQQLLISSSAPTRLLIHCQIYSMTGGLVRNWKLKTPGMLLLKNYNFEFYTHLVLGLLPQMNLSTSMLHKIKQICHKIIIEPGNCVKCCFIQCS